MSVGDGADLEPRVSDLEYRVYTVEEDIREDIAHLTSICSSTAVKVAAQDRELQIQGEAIARIELATNAALHEAREARGAIPPMRAALDSHTTEIEEIGRNVRAATHRASREFAAEDRPDVIEANLTRLVESIVLQSYRNWRKTLGAVARKITWGLWALAGAGVLHALRLGWELIRHH